VSCVFACACVGLCVRVRQYILDRRVAFAHHLVWPVPAMFVYLHAWHMQITLNMRRVCLCVFYVCKKEYILVHCIVFAHDFVWPLRTVSVDFQDGIFTSRSVCVCV